MAILVAGTSCGEETSSGVVASATVGPDGGEVQGGPVSLSVPPGALFDEIEISVHKDGTALARGELSQVGSTYRLEPAGLRLQLPAELTLGEHDSARLLHDREGQLVLHGRASGYIDRLGRVTLAEASDPGVELIYPALAVRPQSGEEFVDSVHMEASLPSSHRFDLLLTAYDYSSTLGPLNGEGYCGFEVTNLTGGSLTTGCGRGEVTASLSAVGDGLAFDVQPFLTGKLVEPVPVEVIVGDGEYYRALGFLRFRTGDCYLETCSGHGTCVAEESATCECDDGFEPLELECVCSPQCDGRECGPDGCGGSCEPGCGVNESCNTDTGMCFSTGDDDDSDDDDMDDDDDVGDDDDADDDDDTDDDDADDDDADDDDDAGDDDDADDDDDAGDGDGDGDGDTGDGDTTTGG